MTSGFSKLKKHQIAEQQKHSNKVEMTA